MDADIGKEIYELVGAEIKAGHLDDGLMVKAYAEAGGNRAVAQSIYIKLRAREIIAQRRRELQSLLEEPARQAQILRPYESSKKEEATYKKYETYGGRGVYLFMMCFRVIGAIFLMALIGEYLL